jgi:glycosyltransferase involved in cell wall biosynthesis
MLQQLDALLVPSEHTRKVHNARGIDRTIEPLPYFIPDTLVQQAEEATPWRTFSERPYFAMAGRLVKEKGFAEVLAQMQHFPQADLLIAGAGPYEDELRRQTAGLGNVQFTGMLDSTALLRLFKGARAVIVPSLFYETFGFVVIEAFTAGTPVIAHNLGPLPDHIQKSQGGLLYDSAEQLREAMRTLLEQPELSRRLGSQGRAAVSAHWSESAHLDHYLHLIEECKTRRTGEKKVVS